MTNKLSTCAAKCLLGTAALGLAGVTPCDARADGTPTVIRGAGTTAPAVLTLAYDATFPDGSLQSSVDLLGLGAMEEGDTLIPGSNPTFTPLPGELKVAITRPVDLSPDELPAASAWATNADFGPGSVLRLSATMRAPVGPLQTGGFAIGLVAKTGGKDDLASEPRVVVTLNVRPGFLLRLNVPFGSVDPTAMVLPTAVRDEIYSTSNPKPFTLDLFIDRGKGTGLAKLTVGSDVFTLPFALSSFQPGDPSVISAAGLGVAVNSNGPGQTASVHLREFRIYTNVAGSN
jgi:hypothetical protein